MGHNGRLNYHNSSTSAIEMTQHDEAYVGAWIQIFFISVMKPGKGKCPPEFRAPSTGTSDAGRLNGQCLLQSLQGVLQSFELGFLWLPGYYTKRHCALGEPQLIFGCYMSVEQLVVWWLTDSSEKDWECCLERQVYGNKTCVCCPVSPHLTRVRKGNPRRACSQLKRRNRPRIRGRASGLLPRKRKWTWIWTTLWGSARFLSHHWTLSLSLVDWMLSLDPGSHCISFISSDTVMQVTLGIDQGLLRSIPCGRNVTSSRYMMPVACISPGLTPRFMNAISKRHGVLPKYSLSVNGKLKVNFLSTLTQNKEPSALFFHSMASARTNVKNQQSTCVPGEMKINLKSVNNVERDHSNAAQSWHMNRSPIPPIAHCKLPLCMRILMDSHN